MSSRALRRMQEGSTAQGLPPGGELETFASSSDGEGGREEADRSPRKAPKGRANLFDLVGSSPLRGDPRLANRTLML
jgi:hypothetical protein